MPSATPVTLTRRAAGLLERVVDAKPGGSRRDGQVAMCEAVADALESGRHLLVEAPTGTGKSLAYAIPAIAHVQGMGRHPVDGEHSARVVISTATKALQEQLVDVDLPAIADALGGDTRFSYAMLKGRSNYLCRARLANFDDTPGTTGALFADDDGLGDLVAWSKTTTTGDRAEAGAVRDDVWAKVSITSAECPGASNCPYGEECFTEVAKRRARDADVVVVNAHLYAAHLASDGNVLPPHDAVVFDEAHELEDIFVSAFSVTVSAARVFSVASLASVGGAPPDAVRRLRDLGVTFEGVCAPHAGDPLDLTAAPDVVAALSNIGQACVVLSTALSSVRPETPTLRTANAQALTAVRSLTDDITSALGKANSDGAATWVEGDTDKPRLCAAPIDVAPILARDLYPATTVIATSATLAVAGTFDIPAYRLGLHLDVGAGPATYDTLVVDTPFDYARQGILYVAKHLPDPSRERAEFEPAARDELAELATAAGGRTLALFTSWASTRAAAEHLRVHTDLRVLCQGDAPRRDLVEEFSGADRAVLVATSSFWTGLDLHGDQCTLVVIDRIPFGRPNDPITVARIRLCESRGGNGFRDVSLPAAAVALAQGVGRLIRSTSDRGVVAVLDRRLATAGYRALLLDTIPPLWRTTDRSKVTAALGRLDAAAREREQTSG